jgi:hypothetical protein
LELTGEGGKASRRWNAGALAGISKGDPPATGVLHTQFSERVSTPYISERVSKPYFLKGSSHLADISGVLRDNRNSLLREIFQTRFFSMQKALD